MNTEAGESKCYFNKLKENYYTIYNSILRKLLSILRTKIKQKLSLQFENSLPKSITRMYFRQKRVNLDRSLK